MELNIEQIKEILPHRYPFLLVDKIVDMQAGSYAKGVKCVSANEMQFLGHFPDKAIMPGVLILEALAQTGAISILSMPENKGKLAVFGGVKNCRFKKLVVPGDVLNLECELTNMRGSVGFGNVLATVNNEVAVSAEISFAIIDA
ncbi:MAG: 3-hydroxyacyl-ACP dehydratase FabZ [Eubacteriales bacterium]